ncbi:P-loop containing nucleoside triphosphate hydrolase protein [Syncephalis fuscata]|nr:P-loop containing nucleoside triphosphate hydrolase protein [Syncephalis fuscata]
MSSGSRSELPVRARSVADDTTQVVSGESSPVPGGSRPPSRAPRRQMYTPTPNFGRSRPQSRFSASRPGTSLGVRRSGGDLLMQQRESDAIQTFLRVRPPPEDEEVDASQPYPSYLRVMNKTEVLLIPPEDDLKARNRVPEQFGFARVFPYNAEQAHIFRNTTMPLVQDLLKRGRDALVFAYGVTNSGKTFTVQGERTDPGVLPRSLNTLFSTIEDRMTTLKMRPVRFCEVELCDDLKSDSAESVIRATSANRPKRGNRKEPPLTVEALAADVVTANVLEPEKMPVDERYRYSVWVSFAEIYTEKAYDLLNTTEAPNNKRKNLIITHCPATGAKYMHGLREVHVRTIEEAYAILELGQRNRTVFSTLLNQTSSRSHSIFTVKLLKIPVDVTEETLLERLDEVAMCRMSIVDLAGQERNKRTHNTGQRLKEAGNINQSLMVLGQCLEALRHNQSNPTKPVVVPYRHSKLTELFQGYFFGEGRAAMIVNLNPFDTNYHETSHVVRFAAAAREVTMNKLENYRRRRPASRGNDFDDDDFDVYANLNATTEEDLDEQDEYIESLLSQITELRQKWMEAEARLSRREAEIREEMTAEMEARARQMETAFAERLRRELALKEESMKSTRNVMVSQGDQTDEDMHHTCREEADRLRRELEEKLALLAERDARLAALQSELESVNVALAEMTQRRETADSLIVSLREELAHEPTW